MLVCPSALRTHEIIAHVADSHGFGFSCPCKGCVLCWGWPPGMISECSNVWPCAVHMLKKVLRTFAVLLVTFLGEVVLGTWAQHLGETMRSV